MREIVAVGLVMAALFIAFSKQSRAASPGTLLPEETITLLN